MNDSRDLFLPLFILAGVLVLLWLYLTEKISGILFFVLGAILLVFAFAKNATFLVSAAVGVSLGYGACLAEKIVEASPMTAVLNLRTAEVMGDVSQRLLNVSNEQARQLRLQFWIKLIPTVTAIIALVTLLLKIHFRN